MRRLLVTGLMMLGLAGCADTVTPMTSVPPAKTVVVIPSIPPGFRVATLGSFGALGFGNTLDIVDDHDWHLNQLAVDAASKVLSPKYDVSSVIPDTILIDTQSRLDAATGLGTDVGTVIKEHVSPLPPADLYIVLCVSFRSHHHAGNIPLLYEDIGVSKQRDPLGTIDPLVHTYLLLTVVDGKTFKTIYDTPLMFDPKLRPPPHMLVEDSYPTMSLNGFDWKDHWAEMTSEQHQLIEKTVKDLLAASIPYTLKQMNIAP